MDNIRKQEILENFKIGTRLLNLNSEYDPTNFEIPCTKQTCDNIKKDFANNYGHTTVHDVNSEEYAQALQNYYTYHEEQNDYIMKKFGISSTKLKIEFHLYSTNNRKFSVNFERYYVCSSKESQHKSTNNSTISKNIKTCQNSNNVDDFVDLNAPAPISVPFSV